MLKPGFKKKYKMKRKRWLQSVACIFVLTANLQVHAQSADELAAKFPNDYGVILNYIKETNIYLKDGVPQALSKVSVEFMITDDKANGSYNRYRVYHGSFDKLQDLEAYTKVPDGKGFKKIKVSEIKTESSRSEGVFYDDVKESAFDFPSLVKGAIAHVNYKVINSDLTCFRLFILYRTCPFLAASLP